MQFIPGNLKQEIIKINNNLNISMYGIGLRQQRVFILDEKTIAILADNKRIPALAALDDTDLAITRSVDVALLSQYKTKFKIELKRELGLSIKCILKDYDPGAELAATVIVLEENSFIK